jgi:hypothetical protein
MPDHDDPPYELRSQIAMRHDLITPKGRETVALPIADAVLDLFVVRERKEPRTSWAD